MYIYAGVFGVASYVGAWIETGIGSTHLQVARVASYVGAWIETCTPGALKLYIIVASYVGAWIETLAEFKIVPGD